MPVGPGHGRRVEHRAAGADANPYFAAAAVLAGLHYGLERKLDPGPPATVNVSREPDLALPFTLDAALARLKDGMTVSNYLGEETAALYGETNGWKSNASARSCPRRNTDWYL